MRDAWMEAERLGASRLYTADHFFVPTPDDYRAQRRAVEGLAVDNDGPAMRTSEPDAKNWEATVVEAAMCATTTRAEISCLVHCNAFRNPNLLADMARTMDHLSKGRFVLGIGSGFHKRDFDEYGYVLGTFGSRLRDLDRDLDVMKARWQRLSPPPTRKIPILMAAGGEQLALQIVARHADEWHWFAELDVLIKKSAVLDEWCEKLGRDPLSIQRIGTVRDGMPVDEQAEALVDAGFTHLIGKATGPDWDLSEIQALLEWQARRAGRDSRHLADRRADD